ncbi:MAG TPA: arginine--tRNA ligase [Desulfobacteraceae bacterium]|nr:arginine--tRNA ligase [Desulfobacteraceae bacterium]
MKQKIMNLVLGAVKNAWEKGELSPADLPDILVEEPKVVFQGDFSTNIAMIMASKQKMAPRKIAEIIVGSLDDSEGIVEKIEVAGPGFINFYINNSAWHQILHKIHDEDSRYGATHIGKGQKIQVEFVSANPTGPLHVGHGRGAAVGDSMANILQFCGYNVQREYYVNDSGRQIKKLGMSVFLRYKESFGADLPFPDDCYQGEYICTIALQIKEFKKDSLLYLPEDEAILYCAEYAAKTVLSEIKEDLDSFGITFDNWFSEQSLYDSGKVDSALAYFEKKGIIYKKDGALWFKTMDFGDEKDRVVVRQNGLTTYFASDIAYHYDKFDRGFDGVIDVWGADHHGYVSRIEASIEASGRNRDAFNVILVQLVNLLRGGKPVAMSTRSGEFVRLKAVIEEVGPDAARFIFLTRHYDSPLDFDLELASKKTNENPVYYVQYVHARICSIMRKAEDGKTEEILADDAVKLLQEPEEINLIKAMERYPEVVESGARLMEPHRIAFYLINLASCFHTYYNKHRVLTEDPLVTKGRLYLILAVKKVIRSGLILLGVSAPEKM